jgi:hypothetical protein
MIIFNKKNRKILLLDIAKNKKCHNCCLQAIRHLREMALAGGRKLQALIAEALLEQAKLKQGRASG